MPILLVLREITAMKKYIVTLCAFLFATLFLSGQSLVINGYIIIDDDGTEGARITIYKNNEKIEERAVSKKGRFDLKFGWDAEYTLSFERTGYISKIVSVNTDVPPEVVESNPNFPPLKLMINLLPVVEGVDVSIFDQPIAVLDYNAEMDDFVFDKEYSGRIKEKIAQTEKAVRAALLQRGAAEKQRALRDRYDAIIAEADANFNRQNYEGATAKYKEALALNVEKEYPEAKLSEIERIQREAANIEKRRAELNEQYAKAIADGNTFFADKAYEKAIETFQSAAKIKPTEEYPTEMIKKIKAAIAAQQQRLIDEENLRKQEEQRKAERMGRYNAIIAVADAAFKGENYAIARPKYVEADELNTGLTYPKERIKAIDAVLNSSKYQQKLAEFKKNREMAEKMATAKNYASAKFYFQQARETLPIDREEIDARIKEIDQLIAAEKSAAIEKEYRTHIEKADAALKEKSYAIAKFYYQKALAVKTGDTYAKQRLAEVEQNIGERTEKSIEL